MTVSHRARFWGQFRTMIHLVCRQRSLRKLKRRRTDSETPSRPRTSVSPVRQRLQKRRKTQQPERADDVVLPNEQQLERDDDVMLPNDQENGRSSDMDSAALTEQKEKERANKAELEREMVDKISKMEEFIKHGTLSLSTQFVQVAWETIIKRVNTFTGREIYLIGAASFLR